MLGRPARFSADPKVDAFAEERLRKAAGVSGFTSVRFVARENFDAAIADYGEFLVTFFGKHDAVLGSIDGSWNAQR